MKKTTAKQQIQKILETHGGKIATQTTNLLLQDPTLKELKPTFEFISKNWRDPLRPAMMKLACEAVGGNPEQTEEVAVAMSLMNLSFYLWDDIIDKTSSRLFKPTMMGKFGEAQTLIIGGLASAKAFTLLNQAKIEQAKREAVTELIWDMWAKMATAETTNLQAQSKDYSLNDKLLKIEAEAAANLENCLKIGATIGNGTQNQISHLGKYGFYLGIILELQHDVQVSLNLTLELAHKIKTRPQPYTLLWAKERIPQLQKNLQKLNKAKTIEPKEIEKIVKEILKTNALEEIEKTIKKQTKQAIKELKEIKKNGAAKALQAFAEIQPQLFAESIARD